LSPSTGPRSAIFVRTPRGCAQRTGSTAAPFVLARRLELAHDRLRDPRFATRTIAAIAGDVGFGDLSYFNRTYRHHFHTTPTATRSAPPTPD
jgi:AraC-like DNA-binding protein